MFLNPQKNYLPSKKMWEPIVVHKLNSSVTHIIMIYDKQITNSEIVSRSTAQPISERRL